MNKVQGLRLVHVIVGLLSTSIASASSLQGELSVQALYYDSTEYAASGRALNQESGWLPGIGGRLQQSIGNAGFVAMALDYHGSRVDYDGQTQMGTPFQSDTRMEMWRGRLEAGVCLQGCRGRVATGMALYGRDRDIQGHSNVLGLYEEYRWREWHLSGQLALDSTRRFTVEAEVFRTLNGEMTVDLQALGANEPVIPLPDSTGWRTQLRYRPGSSPFSSSVGYESLDIARSDAVSVHLPFSSLQVREPESQARHWLLGLHWYLPGHQ